ncbi:MAG: hypothetical protein IPK13_14195 [Deltaproteobacteria bacterium]|nr:hypothetical protein [Deltaproteobacteria bacterium]
MKHFEARRGGRLRALSFHARLVYSVFCGFTTVGLALTLWLAHAMVGLDLSGLGAYYAGTPGGPPSASAVASSVSSASSSASPSLPSNASSPSGEDVDGSGPSFDLPDDADDALKQSSVSTRKLLEVTHFHLFTVPVLLLILSHLFMLSSAGDRLKTVTIIASGVSTAAHIAAPWLVAHWPGPLSTALFGSSGAVLTGTLLLMSWVPVSDMWFGPSHD